MLQTVLHISRVINSASSARPQLNWEYVPERSGGHFLKIFARFSLRIDLSEQNQQTGEVDYYSHSSTVLPFLTETITENK